jgi:hypothetical protein
MPAPQEPQATVIEVGTSVDGVLLAPIPSRGPWSAMRAMRSAMAQMRQRGLAPRLAFVYALTRGGRIVAGRNPDATLFVLGYRLVSRD